jgi:putative NADPH-quinone reductase
MSKVLILFAHPSQSRSEINFPLFNASNIKNVTCVDLYSDYSNFRINIEKEQQRLVDHDVIIFMFPMYWYSTPAILKEWQDLVLEYGFAYGKNGKQLKDKMFLCAMSAGAPENAFQCDGINHYGVHELLQPLEQMASLCGMHYIPPYVMFSARTASEDQRINKHVEQWVQMLTAMTQDRFDFKNAVQHKLLNPLGTLVENIIHHPRQEIPNNGEVND